MITATDEALFWIAVVSLVIWLLLGERETP
mgnify:CR=1 FL=1